MIDISKKAEALLELLNKEQKSQSNRWGNDEDSIKTLRNAGELLYPLNVKKHSYSFDDFPTIQVHYSNDYNERIFTAGASVLVFNEEGEECKASIRSVDDRELELLLFKEELPSWVLEDKIGLKPQVDEKSFTYMKGILRSVINDDTNQLSKHLEAIYNSTLVSEKTEEEILSLNNESLNSSQQEAIKKSLGSDQITTIQGPPGTGKTTTLVEIIQQFTNRKQKVIASAPSNTAVDNLAIRLLSAGIKIIRLGNTAKVNEAVWSRTPEGILASPVYQKQLKKLRIEVNELRKKAQQYKRTFTKEDRENRKMWRNQAREITKEIRALTQYHLSKQIEEADVILGTPVGICHGLIKEITFDVGIIDEAGQCLTPMGFLVMDNAKKIILCGDQQQLPPTVIDRKAEKEGLGVSILEEALQGNPPNALLTVQYRMPMQIAAFSSNYFYQGLVESWKTNEGEHLLFYDTAGAGYKEQESEDGSKWNSEELDVIEKIIQQRKITNATFISPYSAQVRAAKKVLPKSIKCSTIDGFQGQEDEIIIISLVRNNEEGSIGFLRDHRRMNVAMTRAKSTLVIVGDSATLSGDKFYQEFLDYVEQENVYKSVFEIMYE
jgi:superfamily I DNA and/or RNA helicase